MLRGSARSLVLVAGFALWGCSSASGPGQAGGGGGSEEETGGSGGATGGSGGASPVAGKGGGGQSGGAGGGASGGVGGGATGGGGSPGTGGATGGSGPQPDAMSAGPDAGADTAPPAGGDGGSVVGPATGIPGCDKCKSIFDGKSLDGWMQGPAGSFAIKDGAIASTGKEGYAWTKDDYGDFRMFLSVRKTKNIEKDHKPCTTMFGNRPTGGDVARGLSGIQFQPPTGGGWDYRDGKNNGPPKSTLFTQPMPRPMFDIGKWHRCEILARASTGTFRAACCEIEGKTSCKAVEVLSFKDPTAGKKGPFALMMHNPGLYDEFKDFFVETDPVGDELISTK